MVFPGWPSLSLDVGLGVDTLHLGFSLLTSQSVIRGQAKWEGECLASRLDKEHLKTTPDMSVCNSVRCPLRINVCF